MAKEKLGLGSNLRIGKKKVLDVRKVDKLVESLNEERTKKMSVVFPESVHKKMKSHVALEGISLKDYIVGLVKDDLDL